MAGKPEGENMDHKWLDWAKQLQSIAQAGLTYSKDLYDIERFQQIRQMSMEIMSQYTNTQLEIINDLFANETGYAHHKWILERSFFRMIKYSW